ncbi:MAG: YiiD C-terminal domain-containing protein [Legionella sp.]|nr:YiiD C-terminal domain-containing protein [Legionella sp.]
MRLPLLLKLMRFWPPFFGAGIKVVSFDRSLTTLRVEMRMRWWNKNYMGTQFGGSLYSMTDPFYVLMVINALGKDYIVWDKAAYIRYKKPARETVFANFQVEQNQIDQIKKALAMQEKIEPEFIISITNAAGDTLAEVRKILHISKKIRER